VVHGRRIAADGLKLNVILRFGDSPMTVAITTAFPTLEEVADNVGLSRHRAQELAALASELTGKQITVYTLKKAARRSPRVGFKKVAFKKK
jgi:hypothetical protein